MHEQFQHCWTHLLHFMQLQAVTVFRISPDLAKKAWETYQSHHTLLQNVGVGEFNDNITRSAERFLCLLFKVTTVTTCDEVRVVLFGKGCSQESLPPTSNAAHFHIRRAHYETLLWKQATSTNPELPQITTTGWVLNEENRMVSKLMSLHPIPDACTAIISYGCTKGCNSQRCGCRKCDLGCTTVCKCA